MMGVPLKLESESAAVELCNKLIQAGLIQHIKIPSKPFKVSTSSLYRIVTPSKEGGKNARGLTPDPILPRGGIRNITFADVDPLEIARQLYYYLPESAMNFANYRLAEP